MIAYFDYYEHRRAHIVNIDAFVNGSKRHDFKTRLVYKFDQKKKKKKAKRNQIFE